MIINDTRIAYFITVPQRGKQNNIVVLQMKVSPGKCMMHDAVNLC